MKITGKIFRSSALLAAVLLLSLALVSCGNSGGGEKAAAPAELPTIGYYATNSEPILDLGSGGDVFPMELSFCPMSMRPCSATMR